VVLSVVVAQGGAIVVPHKAVSEMLRLIEVTDVLPLKIHTCGFEAGRLTNDERLTGPQSPYR
jgi:hypothetical protein